MKPKPVIAALFLLAVPAFLMAQDLGLKRPAANIPEKYVVREGDTLWDISGTFLGNPFSWQELWKRNEFIRDPHWIYPGQTLVLGLNPGQPSAPEIPPAPPVAAPAPAEEETPASPAPANAPVQIASAIRLPETIEQKDGNVIRSLREPRPVFTEKNFIRTGFIAKRSGISRNRILKVEGEQGGAIRYDMVVVNMGAKAGLKKGDLLAVIAIGDRVKHPDTGYDYGFVVRIKGVLRVESAGEDQSRCTVTETFDPLAVDDLAMPYSLSGGPLFDAWLKPDAQIQGVILAVNEPMLSIHTEDILYIDKGERDGVRPGDIFTVHRRTKVESGDGSKTELGILEAVNVMPGETAVIVTALEGETVNIGDRVELSARCRLVGK
ncbi:MAG: LysM peptidoglycan-binding domain-containing protein [Candidatus Latescibacterota bacterium]